jgi:hypothetical protein
VLQRRPNTFAQTILSVSFFACDKAADHTFRLARQNDLNTDNGQSGEQYGAWQWPAGIYKLSTQERTCE